MLLLLYLFAFIARSEAPKGSPKHAPVLSMLQRVGLVGLGFGSGLPCAVLIGQHRAIHDTLIIAVLIGAVLGVIVSRLLVGRPNWYQKKSE